MYFTHLFVPLSQETNELLNKMKKYLMILMAGFVLATQAQINRHAVVARNNPVVTAIDSLASLTVGNGGFAFTVDATGLQSFPDTYRNGIPLGTMSDWGWHSFPNTEGYQANEALKAYDFGHHNGIAGTYSVENAGTERQKEAANYLRANPHRIHLGCIGLDLKSYDQKGMKDIHQELDLWNGIINSRFNLWGNPYSVTTACHPDRDMIAVTIESGQEKNIVLRFPYPTGKHTDDACDWEAGNKHNTQVLVQEPQYVILKRTLDSTTYYIKVCWEGEATFSRDKHITPNGDLLVMEPNNFHLYSEENCLKFICEFIPEDHDKTTYEPSLQNKNHMIPIGEVFETTRNHWNTYWNEGGIVDFSHCKDPRAKELERRVVLSQYLLAVNCAGDTPPQETGLTYNSWFGKYHLEMIWWHQAQFALWGHPELLERSLDWYFKAAPKARDIARRQGFDGLRWMKMTDPSAEEAPSKVGSFLIWQQPHLIYLAELLRRADKTPDGMRIVNKYGDLVEETARFMFDFADYDAKNDRYVLKGIIPAQETLRAAETVNPPFELSYWHWGMQTAMVWQQRRNRTHIYNKVWNGMTNKLSPLAYNTDQLYLAAETATDTYRDIRFTSDHPALLGAFGIMPYSPQVNRKVMRNTLNWIWDHWNWNKTWGWDYPMVAMTAARLNEPQKAVDALLMDKRTNTYLVSGHNYQDQRLRLYLPGNGGLLTAVALMCAGWDGCTEKNPGFPHDGSWDVRWEGIQRMP